MEVSRNKPHFKKKKRKIELVGENGYSCEKEYKYVNNECRLVIITTKQIYIHDFVRREPTTSIFIKY